MNRLKFVLLAALAAFTLPATAQTTMPPTLNSRMATRNAQKYITPP